VSARGSIEAWSARISQQAAVALALLLHDIESSIVNIFLEKTRPHNGKQIFWPFVRRFFEERARLVLRKKAYTGFIEELTQNSFVLHQIKITRKIMYTSCIHYVFVYTKILM